MSLTGPQRPIAAYSRRQKHNLQLLQRTTWCPSQPSGSAAPPAGPWQRGRDAGRTAARASVQEVRRGYGM